MKISYILDPNLSILLEPKYDDNDQIKVKCKKCEENKVVCRGQILYILFDRLYDLFISIKSPRDICAALEFKYKIEK